MQPPPKKKQRMYELQEKRVWFDMFFLRDLGGKGIDDNLRIGIESKREGLVLQTPRDTVSSGHWIFDI